ncbi:MAG: hypothetical protein KKF33_01875 [Alphaproteobacteria bacterium]|nr:hypothetical protein [Alphaproteobacteria bacterium]
MKLIGTIVGALMILLGAVWTLQGANVLSGSVMSGQSQWLYIGLVLVLAGAALIFLLRRPAPPRL